ncbi:MAG TPA: hypothetical protein VK886_18500 [Vicinamibacterales bacterium]|nr:hypothetical protein [Vicinamibacterales bacterium]
MIRASIRSGWRAAFASPRLVAVVWAWSFVFAAIAAVAAWWWLGAAFNHAPESDRTLARFQFGLYVELQQYDRFSPVSLLRGAVLALLAVGAIANPLLAAGVLEVLVSRDDRPLLHRFFRGAGHFFGRFLRLLLIGGLVTLLAAEVVSTITSGLVRAVGESSWERAWLAAALARLLLIAGVFGLGVVVLDIARARVALAGTEVRSMLRTWVGAAAFVARNFRSVLGIYASFAALIVLVLGAYAGVSHVLPASTPAGIFAAFALQQLFMVVRGTFRVARAGAAVEFCRLREPRVATLAPAEVARVEPPVEVSELVPQR